MLDWQAAKKRTQQKKKTFLVANIIQIKTDFSAVVHISRLNTSSRTDNTRTTPQNEASLGPNSTDITLLIPDFIVAGNLFYRVSPDPLSREIKCHIYEVFALRFNLQDQ